ncbi:MAG: exonuclease [Oligosphaeraceae bacterium]|nr:exonuclease [Oligosphaeraceae bacterium]
MKLAGLDFETANQKNGSICAAGCVVLEDGVVIEHQKWLICPHKGYRWMRPDFTEIHGLTYWDVCDCDEFNCIWPELRRMLLSADCVIIHNAPFDLRHLRSVLALYELPPVAFYYADSLFISRKLYPSMRSHSLAAMADHFGIVFQHHDALEDAFACASIVAQTGIPEGYIKYFTTEG